MTRIAIYPGSFDPPTRGHEDLVRRSLALADRLIVAVAVNVGQAAALLGGGAARTCCAPRWAATRGSRFESFDGLLAEFAKQVGAIDHRARACGR